MSNIKNFLENYKSGSFVSMTTERKVKVLAKFNGLDIVKRSEMVVRLGMDYDNLKQTEELRNSGELPKENAGLPWGKWEMFPFLITHNDKEYVRVYANKAQIKTKWFLNGAEVSKAEVEPFLTSAEKKEYDDDKGVLTFSVTADTITNIGQKDKLFL